MKLRPLTDWKHIVLVIVIVLGAMFLFYTIPRWTWGFGLDVFPELFQ